MADVVGMARAMARQLEEADRDIEKAITERDAAQEAMSQAFYLVTGRSPEWSNLFGYAEALEEIGDAVAVLKQSTSR